MANQFKLHAQLEHDSVLLCDWPLCQVRLINDSQYPWYLLVPRVVAARDVIDLSDSEQQQLWQESALLSRWLRSDHNPDKLNLAALGNMVPQLHLHHIARFKTDRAWPAPVWGKFPATPYTAAQLAAIMLLWQDRMLAAPPTGVE